MKLFKYIKVKHGKKITAICRYGLNCTLKSGQLTNE